MRLVLATLALTISSAYSVFGATVQLGDGRILDGDVVRQSPTVIWMNAPDGSTYAIPRRNISWFSSDTITHSILQKPAEPTESERAAEARPRPEPREVSLSSAPRATPPPAPSMEKQLEPAPISVSYERSSTGSPASRVVAPPFQFPQPATEAQANALRDAIPMLSGSADPGDRTLAEDTIHSAGPAGLTALVQYGLYNPLPSVRTRAVGLLGSWGGPSVTKYLIEAFYSGAYPTLPPFQIAYMEALATQVSRLTGREFYFYANRSSRAPELANAMAAWWTENWRNLPPQLGEPPLDPSRADFEALLADVRGLNLSHRDFPGANLPTEVIAAPLTPTPAEQQFLNTFPLIPRDAIGNFGSRTAPDQEPIVVKTPDPARDAPGQFRQQNYAERLRELESR